ncbi:transferrin-binding protein-like solute binding protein [Ursidibacter sp. B-7004-1]
MKLNHLYAMTLACSLVLTACSSGNNPRRMPEQKVESSSSSSKESKVEKDLEDAKNQLAVSSENLKKAELALEETKNRLEGEITQLKEQLEKLSANNEDAAKAKQKELEAKITSLEGDKNQLLEEIANNKLTEEQLVELNKVELRKGFVDNGRDATTGIAYISGGKIDVANNTLKFDAVTDKSQKINELVIDGKTLTVFDIQKMKSYQDESKDKNEIFDITENGVKGKVGSLPTRKLGDDFAQMRFGYVTDENGKSTLFVQGVQTPTEESIKSPFSYYRVDVEGETENIRELPKSGRFEYQGYAFYGEGNKYNQFGVKGMADLDNKKVKVDVLENDKTKLTLGGIIDGNSFAGSYQGVEVKGAFYGTKGQDIGGAFYQTEGVEKGFNGVFGATQRDCGWRGCETPAETLVEFNVKK